MKKMYSTIMMLAMMVAAMSFTACGDDNEDDVNHNEVQGGNESPISIGKRLVSISNETYRDYVSDKYKDEHYTFNLTITYDDKDRIIQISEGDEITNITYDGLYILLKTNGAHIQHTLYNGKIIESTLSTREFGDNAIGAKNIYKDDYLIERTYTNSTYLLIPDYEKYSWNDGNLVKMEKEYYNKIDFEETDHGETIIEYSKYKDINGVISSIVPGDFGVVFSLRGTVGYLGKSSTNLPLKQTSTDYNSSGKELTKVETSYDWEVDNDFPIKVTINRETHGGENDNKETSTLIFEWE